MATDEDDPARHPLVVAMRALLRASHGQSGRAIRSAVREAAALAHEVATCGSLGEHDAALSHRESLDGLEADASSVESELRLVWDTLVLSRELPRAEGLDFEEIEELVLAHLLAFPDFLADALVMNFLRQVQLGQSFLHAEDQRINVAAVLQQLQPQLEKHKATAAAIAAEQLLKDESFADDFHEAMCTALIRNGTVQADKDAAAHRRVENGARTVSRLLVWELGGSAPLEDLLAASVRIPTPCTAKRSMDEEQSGTQLQVPRTSDANMASQAEPVQSEGPPPL
ncbi:unnamed protein product [Effrenium voratum]|uniref:Uncharacterized protein n=1 Tax=Effrenium voratum TaxID=2562239 RepID=A0AA36NCJ8_9DINO|nr:unnamed protein product [Effrenium voratum]